MRAYVGTNLLDSVGTAHEVDRAIKHESYSPQTLANDLALIRVKTQFNLDSSDGLVNSVCLPAEGQKFTQYVTISGYSFLHQIPYY